MSGGLRDVVNAEWLKATYLLGVDLTLDDGSEYPDIIFEQNLDAAIQSLADDLEIDLTPRKICGERHDSYVTDSHTWWLMALKRTPLWGVDRFSFALGNYPIVEAPLSWVFADSWQTGEVQLVPSIESFREIKGGNYMPFGLGGLTGLAQLPGYFSFDYTAGFPEDCGLEDFVHTDIPVGGGSHEFNIEFARAFHDDQFRVYAEIQDDSGERVAFDPGVVTVRLKTTNKNAQDFRITLTSNASLPNGDYHLKWTVLSIPSNILHAVGLSAALQVLDVAGDLIVGAGIASQSTSVDGLSQSINTTSSATNSGYGARVKQYEREYKALLSRLRSTWTPREVAGI